jgi:hypothetical protein
MKDIKKWLPDEEPEQSKQKDSTNIIKNSENQATDQEIFTWCLNQINKKESFIDGNRNQYIDKLAALCNERGVSEGYLLQGLTKQFAEQGFTSKEIESIVHSVYRNKSDKHNTRPFITEKDFRRQILKTENSKTQEPLPTFTDRIYDQLPSIFKYCLEPFHNDPAKDVFFCGLLTLFSGLLSKYHGKYFSKRVESNLKLLVIGSAGEGKGILTWLYSIAGAVHAELKERGIKDHARYNAEKIQYEKDRKEIPFAQEPQPAHNYMLFIPINNSVAGVYELLSDNTGRGIMMSTEADTMNDIFKSDYGDFTTLERQSFQHEPVSYYRKTNRQYIEIEFPCLSTMLSGTPHQAIELMKSVENGLFSRYLYYIYDHDSIFKNPFNIDNSDLYQHFQKIAEKLLKLYTVLENNEIRFTFTPLQKLKFTEHYKEIEARLKIDFGREAKATVRRIALSTFRIAMIISFFRYEDETVKNDIECTDQDFQLSLDIANVFLCHAMDVFQSLPKPSQKFQKNGSGISDRDVMLYLYKTDKMTSTDINKLFGTNYDRSWFTKYTGGKQSTSQQGINVNDK